MADVVIEVQGDNRYLSHYRGFMCIKEKDAHITHVAYDDILSVIVSSYGCSISNRLLQELAERSIPFIVTGKNFVPLSIALPVVGNHDISTRLKLQINAKEPFKKQVWAMIIGHKIKHQAKALEYSQHHDTHSVKEITHYASLIRSGDSTNIEGQVARKYFPLLFGKQFLRRRNLPGINEILNYGYICRQGI